MTVSWVIVRKEDGKAIFEIFNRHLLKTLNTAKYEAVPIQKYLASLNAKTV